MARSAIELACHHYNRCCEMAEIVEMFCMDADAAEAAPSPSMPFVPWSKEAEMLESWAAPSTNSEKIGCVQHDCAECKARKAAPSTSPAESWVPDLEHVANEWADGLCDASVGLSNIRDGIETVDVLIERVNDSIKHCREVRARWQAAQATSGTSLTEAQVTAAIDKWFSKEFEYNSSMETRMRAAIEAAHGIKGGA